MNDAIVKEIPLLLKSAQQGRKTRRQILISTHSEALLSNPGIDARDVILLVPGPEGTTGRPVDEQETHALKAGLSIAEAVLPKARPANVGQLRLVL